MHIYGSKAAQERLALRKAEKIEKSSMFNYYLEEAQKITEAEIKNAEHRHKESEKNTSLTDILQDRYLDEFFENGSIFGDLRLDPRLFDLFGDIFK